MVAEPIRVTALFSLSVLKMMVTPRRLSDAFTSVNATGFVVREYV